MHRPSSAGQLSQSRSVTPATLLGVPPGYRPLGLRASSPTARAIIRVDLAKQHGMDNYQRAEAVFKDIDYNINRLSVKKGLRNKSEKVV